MSDLTHLGPDGQAHMVEIGQKAETQRRALAEGFVRMAPKTLQKILDGDMPKGDVLGTARLAGIMAAKQTSTLIPLCHPVALTSVTVDLKPFGEDSIQIEAEAHCHGKTGVEMEALTAVSVAALTLYDMAKAIDKAMTIEGICLLEKDGGRSGSYRR